MAAFWGDIVPVSSRAVNDDDDDDDDVDLKPDCDMIWNPALNEQKLACRLLIIADGEAASQFVDSALLWRKDSVLAGVLNSGFVQVRDCDGTKMGLRLRRSFGHCLWALFGIVRWYN